LRSVRRAWAGLRTFTPDRNPAVGRDAAEPSFVWLAGQGGAGIKTAPALAELVADVITDDAAPPPDLDVRRFVTA
jgi:D-arginine dehydrogenase